jgi:hypothetical protein
MIDLMDFNGAAEKNPSFLQARSKPKELHTTSRNERIVRNRKRPG